MDERRGEKARWWDEQVLGSRARLQVGAVTAVLTLAALTPADQGLYTCRVDFRLQATKTTRISLALVGKYRSLCSPHNTSHSAQEQW